MDTRNPHAPNPGEVPRRVERIAGLESLGGASQKMVRKAASKIRFV